MRKYFKQLPHYLPLLGIATASVLAFIVFSYDKNFQIGIVISVAAAHMAWGIVHHLIHGDFSAEIVLEYMAIALLGISIALSVILHI